VKIIKKSHIAAGVIVALIGVGGAAYAIAKAQEVPGAPKGSVSVGVERFADQAVITVKGKALSGSQPIKMSIDAWDADTGKPYGLAPFGDIEDVVIGTWYQKTGTDTRVGHHRVKAIMTVLNIYDTATYESAIKEYDIGVTPTGAIELIVT